MVPDILYVWVYEYLNLRQEHMTIKEFSIRLNALAQYALDMVNTNKEKLNTFINTLRLEITKDMLTIDNPSKSYEGIG